MAATHLLSQRYLSTRGGSYDLSFEEVVLKGLASDGGLFIPEAIPTLPRDWQTAWRGLSFAELAGEVFALFVAPAEVPPADARALVQRSYAGFRAPDVTPLVTLDARRNLHVLELFHGPTFAFKDVALQLLGNLFEYFLRRKNEKVSGGGDGGGDGSGDAGAGARAEGQQQQQQRRHRLTVIGATSGDTGSAAIYGLKGKQDVSVFILFPNGKVSPIQEAQMTSVLDANVHNVAVEGTFDDCQAIVKALFADPTINKVRNLAAVNSINWARIMAQITYYFHAYFALLARSAAASSSSSSSSSAPQPPQLRLRFVVPTGNFGDVLAGYYAKRMGLPVERLVIATNENDILHRFWQGGRYEKHAVHGRAAQGGLAADGAAAHASGVKQTLSPAMDILVSSNFERLLWYLAYEAHMAEIDAGAAAGDGASNGETDAAAAAVAAARKAAGARVAGWLDELKRSGGFGVDAAILDRARRDFASERVSDAETVETVRRIYTATRKEKVPDDKKEGEKERRLKGPSPDGYVLDPHTAVGVTAALRCIDRLPPASSPTTMAHPQSNGAGEKGNGANDDGARAESGDGPSENAVHHVALATAHPAKFAHAVELALAREPGFAANAHLPAAFVGLAAKEKRRLELGPGKTWEDMRALILDIDC